MSIDTETTVLCRRLLVLPLLALAVVAVMFILLLSGIVDILMVSYIVFACGVIGGFVSIQQRIKKMSASEIASLSSSWCQVLLMPTYGGIFALVLYLLFFSGIISGHLFPEIYLPKAPEVPDIEYLRTLFTDNYPSTGEDFGKLMFWSFVAGFCERFVPQVVRSVAHGAAEQQD